MRLMMTLLTCLCLGTAGTIVYHHEYRAKAVCDEPMTMQTTDKAGVSLEERLEPITGPRNLGRSPMVSVDDSTSAVSQHWRLLDSARTTNRELSTAKPTITLRNPTGQTVHRTSRRSTQLNRESLYEQAGSIFADSAMFSHHGSVFTNINSRRATALRLGANAQMRAATARGNRR